ncbi:MAG TPA: acyltransferase [Caulifigura sp.]|nr:acyltransferase [Caulifigura sp.]
MSSAPNTLRFAAAPIDSSAAAPPRMPGLDWLRAGAAMAVVALHAGIPYMTHPLPALEWCVRSSERSSVVDALCWAINVAVMPTFFLMGGALAAGVWTRSPGQAFLIHRSRRLLLPLAFAVLFVLPADMYVWLIGWFTQGLIPWKKVLSIKLPSPLSEQFWGVAHLWYLECLWTLSALAFVVLTLRSNWRARRTRSLAPASPGSRERSPRALSQLAIVLAAGMFLSLDPTFLIGFQQTWWPGPAAIAFYGLFFAAGWMKVAGLSGSMKTCDRRSEVIEMPAGPGTQYSVLSTQSLWTSSRSEGSPRIRLVLAAGLFALLLPQIHRHVETTFSGLELFALSTAYAACGWLAATGLFAQAKGTKALSTPSSVAFTAEASFWMYLVHHPLVALTQLSLLQSAASPLLRFACSLTVGIALSLTSYAVLVRGTWIARLLDGRGLGKTPETPGLANSKATRRAA